MNVFKEHHYEIVALETPKVLNHCHKCRTTMEFYCSGKFRVNAQQKSIDAWLIYKCTHCDSTWNYPILSRVHTNSLDPELHRSMMSNDRETAWHFAFQADRLRKVCIGVNTDVPYTLKTDAAIGPEERDVKLHLISKYKWGLRLDRVLRELLGVSRSKLEQWADDGSLTTDPQVRLNGKLKEDVTVILSALRG
jgi:hypothetical protein